MSNIIQSNNPDTLSLDSPIIFHDPYAFLEQRLNYLGQKGQKERGYCNFSKSLGISSLVISAIASSALPPMAPITLCAGALCYGWSVMLDKSRTGRFRLFPAAPSVQEQIMNSTEDPAALAEINKRRFSSAITHLPPHEYYEAYYMSLFFAEIGEILYDTDVKKRRMLYKTAVRSLYTEGEYSKFYYVLSTMKERSSLMSNVGMEDYGVLLDIDAESIPEEITGSDYHYLPYSEREEEDSDDYEGYEEDYYEEEQGDPWDFRQQETGYQRLKSRWSDSRLFLGEPGTGKSYLLYNVSLALSREGVRVFIIDIGHHEIDDKSTNWNHCSESVICDLSTLSNLEAEREIKKAERLLQNFLKYRGEKLLILEEAAIIFQIKHPHEKKLVSFRSRLTSAVLDFNSRGTKKNGAIYLITQHLKAGMLSDIGKVLKVLDPCLTAVVKGRKAVAKDRNQNVIHKTKAISDFKHNFGDIYTEMPVFEDENETRGLFIDCEWFPMGGPADIGFSPNPVGISKVKWNHE
ncbi:MAG: ATP-binding protein [Moorea sp. SIO2I5]|nr:ATP-binding protein [Moorena sp. SIO2I5]